MKRRYLILLLLIVLIISCVIAWQLQPKYSALTIKFDGVPAAGLIADDTQTPTKRVADASGTFYRQGDPQKQQGIFVPIPSGGTRMIFFPRRGHLTVDIRGRIIATKHVLVDLGFYESSKESEQLDLTDAEVAQLESGQTTIEEIRARILAES